MLEVCVSGASGFVGRHLLDRLSREKDVTTVALSRQPVARADVRFVRGDLLVRESLPSFVRPRSVVVHLAYSTAPGSDNSAAAENLAEIAVSQRASRFIHVSTAVVVGHCRDRQVDESTTCAP